jgi:hypothetical protein
MLAPKQPASGKERRRMLKVAVWRLAGLAHTQSRKVLVATPEELDELINRAGGSNSPRCAVREARHLVNKIIRLRKPASAPKTAD